jgi:hypothetical protein
LGTPCSSWSQARRGPPGSSWCRIPSSAFILGLPNFSETDAKNVAASNKTAEVSADIIALCCKLGVPCALENPATSMIFSSPYLSNIISHKNSSSCVFDFCAYGTRWRRRTKVVSSHFPEIVEISKKCSSKSHVCSFSGKPHVILTGADKSSGRLWTAIAEPYPQALCRKLAQLIDDRIATCQHQHRISFLRLTSLPKLDMGELKAVGQTHLHITSMGPFFGILCPLQSCLSRTLI